MHDKYGCASFKVLSQVKGHLSEKVMTGQNLLFETFPSSWRLQFYLKALFKQSLLTFFLVELLE